MSAWILAATLKGIFGYLLVAGADAMAARFMRAAPRRLWWVLIPLAFLLPVRIPVSLPAAYFPTDTVSTSSPTTPLSALSHEAGTAVFAISHPSPSLAPWLFYLWLAGASLSGLAVIVPTVRVHRAWSHARLSTDSRLLNLLEDAKARAGVTAPIGLVVSDALPAPALLGWLRPRILLPRLIAENAPPAELQAILLHELAHFRTLDIPLNWLFVLARTVHWFNPFAWLAASAWARFREEAADETAIGWLRAPDPADYGEVLLKTLAQCSGGATPFGALAIGESLSNLKRRMHMIRTYPTKSRRTGLAAVVTILLAVLVITVPATAQDDEAATAKKDAAAAMQTWLADLDAGDYAKCWHESAQDAQKAVTLEQWSTALNGARTPVGKLLSRKQVSILYQTVVPHGTTITHTHMVIAQFDSSFENLKYAVETVAFEKEADGTCETPVTISSREVDRFLRASRVRATE